MSFNKTDCEYRNQRRTTCRLHLEGKFFIIIFPATAEKMKNLFSLLNFISYFSFTGLILSVLDWKTA